MVGGAPLCRAGMRQSVRLAAGDIPESSNVGACLSIRLAFQEVYDQPATESATGIPEKWYTGPPTAGSDR